MGTLIYAGTSEHDFEDRTLAHVKVAVSMRLRRQESFFLSWTNPTERGSGRYSLWIAPTIPLAFHFLGSRAPELNPEWIEVLHELSHTARGLIVVSEKDAEEHLKHNRHG